LPITDEIGLGMTVVFVAWHLLRTRAKRRLAAAG
jgi:hypothetical protein